jgi:hypothetical protein
VLVAQVLGEWDKVFWRLFGHHKFPPTLTFLGRLRTSTPLDHPTPPFQLWWAHSHAGERAFSVRHPPAAANNARALAT